MAVPVPVNGFNLEKTVNSKYKGVIYEYKNEKKFCEDNSLELATS